MRLKIRSVAFESLIRLALDTAYRNSTLQAAYFMMVARGEGLDCGQCLGLMRLLLKKNSALKVDIKLILYVIQVIKMEKILIRAFQDQIFLNVVRQDRGSSILSLVDLSFSRSRWLLFACQNFFSVAFGWSFFFYNFILIFIITEFFSKRLFCFSSRLHYFFTSFFPGIFNSI